MNYIEFDKSLFPNYKKKYDVDISQARGVAKRLYEDFPNPHCISIKHKYTLRITEQLDWDINAMVDHDNKEILISKRSLKTYSTTMTERQAFIMHAAHECFHIFQNFELSSYFRFKKYRHTLFEIGAYYYSQLCADVPHHPIWYENKIVKELV